MAQQHDIEELADLTIATLKAYLEDPEPDKHDETRAKIAASAFSTVVRHRQTQGARDALQWSMASMLMSKEQLQQYVRVSMPDSFLAKALPAPQKDA